MPLQEVLQGSCSWRFLRYFFFQQLFIPSDDWALWNNRCALWSMSAFFGFYLIAPFLFRIFNSFWKSFSLTTILLLLNPYLKDMLSYIVSNLYPKVSSIDLFVGSYPLCQLYCFSLGITLYFARKEKKSIWYCGILLCYLIGTLFNWYAYELIFTLLIAVAVTIKPIFKDNKVSGIITYLSSGSFTLYLCHPNSLEIALIIAIKLGMDANIPLLIVWMFTFSIVTSYICYSIVIKPIEGKVTAILLSKEQ